MAALGLRYLSSSFAKCMKTPRSYCWMKNYATSTSNSTVPTLMKTYQKVFELPEDGKISRHNFVKVGENMRKLLEKISPIESFFVYTAFLNIADGYHLTKFPEDGGKIYTIPELCEVLGTLQGKELTYNITVFARALFRAIDTDADGCISREEWIVNLKTRQTYESDEQAMRSFDSLDTNKDGKISLEEYEDFSLKFWTSSGTNKPTANLYGTQ